MKILSLNIEPLKDQRQIDAIPPVSQSNRDEAWEKFLAWTNSSPGKIKSGYREEVLSRSYMADVKRQAQDFRNRFSRMIVLGIGGSSLGSQAVYDALNWSVPKQERRDLIFWDNLDPLVADRVLQNDLRDTAVVVISKSGGTLETVLQLGLCIERFESAGLNFEKQCFAISDPKSGPLRAWIDAHAIPSLPAPPSVGGRYSVFTPVGMFPLAFAGIDVDKICLGAIQTFQFETIDKVSLQEFVERVCDYERGPYASMVFWVYGTVLKQLGAWWVQLWGESLGKIDDCGARRGLLPSVAVGATDQHSLLQFLKEGPHKHLVTGLSIKTWPSFPQTGQARKIPVEFAQSSIACGQSFGSLLNIQKRATFQSLNNDGIPSLSLELRDLSPESVGSFMAFWMDATVLSAAYMGVDPFNQPGVEDGKKLTMSYLSDVKIR